MPRLLSGFTAAACLIGAMTTAVAQAPTGSTIEAIWRLGQQVGALQAALERQEEPAARVHLQNVLAMMERLRCLNPMPWQSLQRRLDQGTPARKLASEVAALAATTPTAGRLVQNLDNCFATRGLVKMVPGTQPMPPMDPRMLLGRRFEWIEDGQVLGAARFLADGRMIVTWTDVPHDWSADVGGGWLVSAEGRRWVTRLRLLPSGELRGSRDASSEVQDGVPILVRPFPADSPR